MAVADESAVAPDAVAVEPALDAGRQRHDAGIVDEHHADAERLVGGGRADDQVVERTGGPGTTPMADLHPEERRARRRPGQERRAAAAPVEHLLREAEQVGDQEPDAEEEQQPSHGPRPQAGSGADASDGSKQRRQRAS